MIGTRIKEDADLFEKRYWRDDAKAVMLECNILIA